MSESTSSSLVGVAVGVVALAVASKVAKTVLDKDCFNIRSGKKSKECW